VPDTEHTQTQQEEQQANEEDDKQPSGRRGHKGRASGYIERNLHFLQLGGLIYNSQNVLVHFKST
jgi:hypothetical protein